MVHPPGRPRSGRNKRVYGAVVPPSPRQSGTDGVDPPAAHAKGSGSDEPATPPRERSWGPFLAGERNPHTLAALRDRRIKAKRL
jgi:hypothetical protein